MPIKAIGTLVLLFVLQLCLQGVNAQTPAKTMQRDLWRTRSDKLTSNLLKDVSKKDALDQALLYGYLSNLWWDVEQNQANTWIESAVDVISFYPAEDLKAQRTRYFTVARELLGLVSTHNRKQSSRLIEVLKKSDEVSVQDKNLNAEVLIDEAVRLAKSNPSAATALGLRALALGFPDNAVDLSVQLRRYDAVLADQFFKTALLQVSSAPDVLTLRRMQSIAFPYDEPPSFPAQLKPPIQLKILFLNVVADYLNQQRLRLISKSISNCGNEAVVALRLKSRFNELLPEKAEMVDQAVNTCLSTKTPEAKQLFEAHDIQTDNVEDLVRQADAIQDRPLVRARYLLRAALTAHAQKKYVRSLEILEKMNDDEKKEDPDLWDELRFESAAGAALSQFREGDISGARKRLNEIPDTLRPLGQITFVWQVPVTDTTCSQLCTELLNDASAWLVKSPLPFQRNSTYWLDLIKLYSNFGLQSEAADTFKKMVVAFNSAATTTDDTQKNQEVANKLIADCKGIIPAFSLELFETKDDAIFEAVSKFSYERVRTQINLQLLNVTLQRYAVLQKVVQKQQQPTK